MLKYFAPTLLLMYFLTPAFVGAAPPVTVKFVILQPANSTVGAPVTITIEARKQNNQVDTAYQNDVTLVTSGSATGGGLVDIVNGVGTLAINDLVAETVTLSLSDTQSTGLDVSSTQQLTFTAPADTTAPSAVSNLATLNVTTSSVDLSWTAPGDDGSTGTATTYDIRYDTKNITNNKWSSATQVTGEPAPQAAGAAQSMTISGLAEGTEYFFAIKTSDEVPNKSALSNIVSTTTLSSVSGGGGGGGGGGTPSLSQQKFLFRDDDGDEVAATGFGAENVGQNASIINVAPGTDFRLRFAIQLTVADGSVAPRLEFKEGADCTTGSWSTVTSVSSHFNLRLSAHFIDSANTTQQLVGGPNFIAGQILESTNPAPTLSMLKNQSTEYEWSLKASSDTPFATSYSFRLTDNGTVLNSYNQCPSLTIQAAPASSGGGGGGAVGGGVRPTTVTFSGKAFPGAKISVVDKDYRFEEIVSQDVVVGDDGSFNTSFVGILQSQHSFGLVIKDKEGRTSQTKFFNIDTLANDLVAKDIVVSPTIGFTNRMVTKGRSATLTGYASPGSSVILEIDDKINKEATAGQDGVYKVEVNTGALDFGSHRVRAKQATAKEKIESDFSPTNTLVVSHLSLPKTDLSGDGRVDIKDWSMFLSQWSSKDTEKKKVIDFNGDGKVDISDFSIFVRNIRKR